MKTIATVAVHKKQSVFEISFGILRPWTDHAFGPVYKLRKVYLDYERCAMLLPTTLHIG